MRAKAVWSANGANEGEGREREGAKDANAKHWGA